MRGRKLIRLYVLLQLVSAIFPSFASVAVANDDLPKGVKLIDGYIPRFLQKRDMYTKFGPELEALRAEVVKRGGAGEYLPCSSQILEETDWLIGSTRDSARVERRLSDLRASLKRSAKEQAAAGEQQPDGGWGPCYEEWFLRLHASADPLKEIVARGEKPKYPLRFLSEVNTAKKVTDRFRRLRTSRVLVDGVDHRKELNLTVTGLGQLLFMPSLSGVLPADFPRADVASALISFMDNEWQDAETGYWGAWYEVGNKVIKTEDLSITFHIASYRDGKIQRLPELIDTTNRTRERTYPYGWQDRGTQNCHHSYDVTRLARFGWPYMTDYEKAFARAQLIITLARVVRLAINYVGEVDTKPYDSAGEAYYFCISLLDEIGYFRPSRNFWQPTLVFDRAPELRQKLEKQLNKLPQNDPMVEAARRKLNAQD